MEEVPKKSDDTGTKLVPEILEELNPDDAQQLDDLLKNVTDENVKKGIEQIISVKLRREHSGPLPSPDSLTKYANISLDLVDKIVGMAEAEQNHRHSMDNKLIQVQAEQQKDLNNLSLQRIQEEFKEAKRGQRFAFVFVILSLVLGFTAIMYGFQWGGAIISAIGVATIAATFIRGRENYDKEDTESEEK